MQIRTLIRYLLGNRQAILEIAASRESFGIGCLFVLSAAFARAYDQEDLLYEPWHLLIPLGASLVASCVLFGVCYLRLRAHDSHCPGFFSAYRSFLGLFWMTAPLAWLYAIPYERFMTEFEATRANLWTLGIVAAWRVLLMIRVISVLIGYHPFAAAALVLLFGDGLAILLLHYLPLPIIDFMSGVTNVSKSDVLMWHVARNVRVIGTLAFVPLAVAAIISLVRSAPVWRLTESDGLKVADGKGLLVLAAGSLAIWVVILPYTQPEQVLRRQVERDLREGRIAEALQLMSTHEPSDFPPHWDPPPRLAYRETKPPLVEVLAAMETSPPSPWVRAIFQRKVGSEKRRNSSDPVMKD